jgi:hypothetical protein
MNFENLLSLLRKERDVLDTVISNLESLDQGQCYSGGRPSRLVRPRPTNGTNHVHRPPDPTPRES